MPPSMDRASAVATQLAAIVVQHLRSDTLHRQIDKWRREVGPEAEGWLGGTYGVTEDSKFIGVVRFESKEAAARNSTRPEQGEWWAETEKCFDGEVTFHGATRPIQGTVNVSLPSPGKLVVSGEQVFDIRDFDIASPTVLMLRIYPDVLVQLQVEAEPMDPAGPV